ncbi:MAG TPA: CBS domain-containing protein [Methanotrichaceae archaeon]|nr:CBS domain-containing protein [Methanotrichaceae archaeon]HQF16259.1 CBS domain-containing protein [Methanotrichaceae archaeon]HQI90031.1 CBS domain-containing protein [Methanotrichaceae archaeon]HQJ27945.1 CBS domain-containing protein [Methanotrichaceae archaeon]
MAIKVADIMSTDPLYVEEKAFVTKARQVVRDNHLRGLPVLDSDGRIKGIVTNQDMLRISSTRSNVTVAGFVVPVPLINEEMDAMQAARLMLKEKITLLPVVQEGGAALKGVVSLVDVFRCLDPEGLPRIPIGEIMSRQVSTATPEDQITKIWDRMLEEDFTGLPVLEGDRPVGMITRFDILKRGWARLGKEDQAKSRDTARLKVEKLMSTPLFSIRPDTTIKEAVEIMMRRDVGRISVVEGEKLVGIVDRYDLIKAVLGEA